MKLKTYPIYLFFLLLLTGTVVIHSEGANKNSARFFHTHRYKLYPMAGFTT